MVILITGITSGFGRAMASQLCTDGHKVYGTYRRDSEQIPGVTYLKADVRDEAALQSAVNSVMDKEGRIDTVIPDGRKLYGYGKTAQPGGPCHAQAASRTYNMHQFHRRTDGPALPGDVLCQQVCNRRLL